MDSPYFEEKPTPQSAEKYPFYCKAKANYESDYFIPPHWHHYIELIYIAKGEIDMMIKGEKHTLMQGDFIWINSDEVHAVSMTKGVHTRIIVLQVFPSVFYTSDRTAFEAKYIIPLISSNQPPYNLFRRQEVEKSEIPLLMNEILEEFNDKSYAYELAMRIGINRIFLWVLRSWKQMNLFLGESILPSDSEIAMLDKLVKYIEVNFAQELRVAEMAKLCCMSYSYFSRYFKRVMGKNFSEYLNFVRITQAEKLLLTTNNNMTEIALQVGFTGASYFIEQFKAIKGISPKQYRKNALQLR